MKIYRNVWKSRSQPPALQPVTKLAFKSFLEAHIQAGSSDAASDPSLLDAFLCPLLDCYKGFSSSLIQAKPRAHRHSPPTLETIENHRKRMKFIKICENQWKSMKIYKNLWKSMKIDNESMKIYENLWKSMKINRKTIQINESLWKFMKSITYMGSICFEKRRWVIFHILNTETPHISVFQKGINCSNKENGNQGFRENMDFDLQNTSQSHFFYENLKWSHGHYGHFAPAGFP